MRTEVTIITFFIIINFPVGIGDRNEDSVAQNKYRDQK